ncbi:hypothetical protein D9X30_5696 [Cupriavidus sp. U2]|uniref:hypothetical protein n=1 Tax=Cupriavidus sp. U2 TaxID=2920269 RepID=UPI00129D7687|nr:hypothetical protein [Cupriavidus sp. U2]KAI3590113.1 hypothetical protein D9X30_5696 [Cupriavidus sp. U2]
MPSSASCFPFRLIHRPPAVLGVSRHRARGDVLVESLVCLAIVGLGAVPLATLGSAWLRWGGQHERLGATLRLAAEQAEARDEGWRLVSGDADRAALCGATFADGGCLHGDRIALATLPPDALTRPQDRAMSVTHIALWVRP